MKICFTCGIEKSFAEFKRDPRLIDGCVNKCLACDQAYENNRRQAKRNAMPRKPLGPAPAVTLAMATQAKELLQLGSTKKRVAAMFGIHENTLRRGMKALGVKPTKPDLRIPYEQWKQMQSQTKQESRV